MKLLGINLTKCVDLYVGNYKTLVNEIKEKLNKLRDNSTFMDRKTPYCQDVSSSQLDL